MSSRSGGGRVTVNIEADKIQELFESMTARGRIAYTTDYAVYVEKTTAYAVPPPFDKLRAWVHRKWSDLDAGLKDVALSESMTPGSERHKDAVTWVVVNSIEENGIEGVFFAGRALQKGIGAADTLASAYEQSDDPRAALHLVEDITDYMFGVSQEIIADEATDTGNLLQSGQVTIEFRGDSTTHEESGFAGGS